MSVFNPVSELSDGSSDGQNAQKGQGDNPSVNVCPRTYMAEGWSEEQAYPILYKFTHRDSLIRFDVANFTMQFGQLWDFADGGAETSSGWRYSIFSPQPIEFHKEMTFTMPSKALEEHYGQNWHVPRSASYVEGLTSCRNRCQVLRVYPFDIDAKPQALPAAIPWKEFRKLMEQYRIKYAKEMVGMTFEVPPSELELFKIESKPLVLFQAAGICKAEGNEYMKQGNAQKALEKYDEGTYIVDKVKEVLRSWRLVFRNIHNEKAEKDRKERGLKYQDLMEAGMPREFRCDEVEEREYRRSLLLNAAQAALSCEKYDIAESRAGQVIELDPTCMKAFYRRGLARASAGKKKLAKEDFLTVAKLSNFDSKQALQQLGKLMPMEEAEREIRDAKARHSRSQQLAQLLAGLPEDERVALQEERKERYEADCQQRRYDKQRDISFDEWAVQYEWRYDAGERAKVRGQWPECFNHMGPAPLPVEDWEVDYLTHKEIDKIVYNRQTAALAKRRLEREGQRPSQLPKPEGYVCQLEVDEEDMEVLKNNVIKKGYNYWW